MQGELPATLYLGPTGEKEVPERFKNHVDCQTACNQMLDSDAALNAWRTDIQRLHDGNPTYSMQAMRDAGQGWRARTNYRGLEGLCDNISTAIYNLDSEVERCVEVELALPEGPEKRDWELAIAKAFTWIIFRQWKGYEYHTLTRIDNMVLHGLGTHVWPDMGLNEWIPRTTRPGTVLFPDDCPLNFEEDGEFFMVRDFWTQNWIYDRIKNEGDAESRGWDIDVTWKALSESSKRITAQVTSDPMYYQRLFKQGDLGYSTTRRAGLWVNMMFVREFERDDSYSLYVVRERENSEGYLFKKRFMFDEIPLSIFPYDNGNGTIQSVRGIGARTKEFFEMDNRVRNASVDSLLFAATMPMRQTGDFDPDKLKLLKLGVLSVLPQGIEPVQGIQFQDVSKGLSQLSGELRDALTQNNQNYMGGSPEAKDRQTFLEYSMRSQDANRAPMATHDLYYRNLTSYYERVLKMMSRREGSSTVSAKLATKFRDRCAQYGVPPAVLNKIIDVRAVRSIGAGSAAARLQAVLMALQYIYPNTTDDRKVNMLRDLASSLFGFTSVDRYAPSLDDNAVVTADESFATVETSELARGGKAAVGEKQNHEKHLMVHLPEAERINQEYLDGQIDPQQAYAAIVAIGEHAAEHLKELEKFESKEPQWRDLYRRWSALKNDAQRIQNELEANNTPPPQQQLSEEGQIKMAKVQLDAQIKTEKMKQDEARKWRKQQFNEVMEDSRTAASLRRMNLGGK